MTLVTLLRHSVLAVALCAASAGVAAQGRGQDRRDDDPRQQGRTLPESVRWAERDGSEVLSAERYPRDGREANRIKVLTPEGRVRVYNDDHAFPRDSLPRDRGGRGADSRRRDDGD